MKHDSTNQKLENEINKAWMCRYLPTQREFFTLLLKFISAC